MNTSQGNAETTTTKRKRKSRVIEGGRRVTRLQAKINDLRQESFTIPSPTPKVLSREPASYPVSCEYSSPDAKMLLKYGRFSRSAKSFEEPENASGPRPEIPTNEYDELEGHSSSDYSPPSQAVIDNILESLFVQLSPRQLGSASFLAGAQREHVKIPPNLSQAMVSSKTREPKDILLAEVPQTEREKNDPSSIPLVANTSSTGEPAMALNVGEEMLEKNANPNSMSGRFNQTVSFGLSEMVGMWGENDSDLDVEASSALPLVTILGYRVKEAFAPTVRNIVKKYGDIAAKCFMKTPEGRSLALENLSEFIQTFQTKKFCELPQLEIEKALALVHDFRTAGLEVDWLQPRLKDMLEAKQLIKQSSTLKERRDKSNQVIKEKKEELEVYEPQLLALQEKVNLAKKKLASAQAEAETIREKVSNAKAKVRFFVDHSPLDGLL